MELATYWLPIIGAGLLAAIAISAWFADKKITGIWFGFAAAVCLLALVALQIQHAIADNSGPSISAKQTRAYVFVETVTLLDDANQIPGAEVVIRNSGQTPAFHVTHWTAMGVAEFPLKNAPPPGPIKIVDNLPAGGKSSNIVRMTRPLNIDEKTVIGMRLAAIYVVGQIDYTDIYGDKRCTKYRNFIGGNAGFNGARMAIAPEGNEIDKDCD